MVCDKIVELGKLLGSKNSKDVLLPYFLKFASDPEPELRNMAAKRLHGFCGLLNSNDIIKNIVPILKNLSTDE